MSAYGQRTDVFRGRRVSYGRGYFSAYRHNPRATADGVVIFADRDGGYGRLS